MKEEITEKELKFEKMLIATNNSDLIDTYTEFKEEVYQGFQDAVKAIKILENLKDTSLPVKHSIDRELAADCLRKHTPTERMTWGTMKDIFMAIEEYINTTNSIK